MRETVWHLGNVWRLPVMLLGRAPVLSLAYGLMWIGRKLEDVGGAIPGLTRVAAVDAEKERG